MFAGIRVGVAVLGLGILGLVSVASALPTDAADKDKPALTGTWERKGAELKLEFRDADVLRVYPHGDKEQIVLVCKYTVDKAGVVKAKVTDVEGKEEFKEKVKARVPIGLEFSLKWTAKDGVAKLDDVKGENTDLLKGHMEGEYEEKK